VTVVYLALGSNLGDRAAQLELAIRLLEASGARVLRRSSVIETEPFGVTEQPRFLNQVVEIEWDGTARELLEAAKAAERDAGRKPSYRWGPREIDIDILLFGDERIDEPDLRVPHPGLWERDFVLRPLAELRPDILERRA
jgi:2-amino-4-hydroxy-6-hydroxymethyldihydropteridine diphosphokinase